MHTTQDLTKCLTSNKNLSSKAPTRRTSGARAQRLLEAIADQAAAAAAVREGQDICAILEPLGLPSIMDAAVQLIPGGAAGIDRF